MEAKSRTTAGILALLLGGIGVHKFYLNRTLQGIVYLLFFWTLIPAIISFIEAILYFVMSDEQFNQKYNANIDPFLENRNNPNRPMAEELSSLYELKQKGVISEEEYNIQKERLLK